MKQCLVHGEQEPDTSQEPTYQYQPPQVPQELQLSCRRQVMIPFDLASLLYLGTGFTNTLTRAVFHYNKKLANHSIALTKPYTRKRNNASIMYLQVHSVHNT